MSRRATDEGEQGVGGGDHADGVHQTRGGGVLEQRPPALEVINDYLRGPDRVLGLVEMVGLMIVAEDERIYRAEGVVVAAILLIDEMFAENHGLLRTLAAEYGALAIRPHSEVPEDYRSEVSLDEEDAVDVNAEWKRFDHLAQPVGRVVVVSMDNAGEQANHAKQGEEQGEDNPARRGG